MKHVEALRVIMWGKQVGALALDPATRHYAFGYDPQWLRAGGPSLSPKYMPLSDRVYVFPDLSEATYKRLPSAIADALPDRFGNALMNEYMATKGVLERDVTELDRLAYIGSRAMGALEFKPELRKLKAIEDALQMSSLVQAAREAVKGSFSNDKTSKNAIRQLTEVGTSAGGAKAKAVIAWNEDTNEIRSGHASVMPGFTDWLIKFDNIESSDAQEHAKNEGKTEYAFYLMTRAAGISMMRSRLLKESGRAHFMTQRFDRPTHGTRAYVQTACAIAQMDFKMVKAYSYEQLFLLLRELGCPAADAVELFKRMVLNVLIVNCDDHTKNTSFLITADDLQWRLSPAYDITHAFKEGGRWTSEHFLSVNGKRMGINHQDMLTVAERFQVPGAKALIATVEAAVSRWPEFAKSAGLGEVEAPWIGAAAAKL